MLASITWKVIYDVYGICAFNNCIIFLQHKAVDFSFKHKAVLSLRGTAINYMSIRLVSSWSYKMAL